MTKEQRQFFEALNKLVREITLTVRVFRERLEKEDDEANGDTE